MLDPYGPNRPRRPTFGKTLMLDASKGANRARAWPTKRGPGKTQAERDRAENFRKAQQITKYIPAEIQAQFSEAVKGTPLLPRDLLVQILYGRFAAIGMADGRKVYNQVARRDVSDSLDVINQQPGSLLFRGDEWWEALLLGNPGDVLIIDGDGRPAWVPAPTAISAAQSANVNVAEATASGAWADLATPGPQVSIVTGTKALVILSAYIYRNAVGAGFNGYAGLAISGATTIAPDDNRTVTSSGTANQAGQSVSHAFIQTGLNAGLNTFKMRYKVNGSNFGYWNRTITVLNLP